MSARRSGARLRRDDKLRRESPPELAALFDAACDAVSAGGADIARRKMFGFPSAFTGGRLCFGLHEHRLVLRLPPERRAALLAAGEASVFAPAPGRPMANFAAVEDPLARDRGALPGLAAEAAAHTAALPPKPARRKRSGGRAAARA